VTIGRVRVAVLSPQPVVKARLETLLEQHGDRFEVVLPPDGPEDPDPDVILYDVHGLHDSEKELTELLELSTAKVLAVGRGADPDLASHALGLGVDGFFGLGVTDVALVDAIATAGTADFQAEPHIAGSSHSDVAHPLGQGDVGLTRRELGALALLGQGLTNQRIAHELRITVDSAKSHLRRAYRKIGATNRTEAASWCKQHGLPTDPDAEV